MRVIAGSARGRALKVPKGADLRPTADRVREAIFDVLEHLDEVVDADVLDLYAGTGAMGIEAASRGAASVTFVERDRAAVATIKENLESTKVGAQCRCAVVRADALSWGKGHPSMIDLALVDPPYATTDAEWAELFATLPAAFVVAESNRELALEDPWVLHRRYRYGTTLVLMARRQSDIDEGPSR